MGAVLCKYGDEVAVVVWFCAKIYFRVCQGQTAAAMASAAIKEPNTSKHN